MAVIEDDAGAKPANSSSEGVGSAVVRLDLNGATDLLKVLSGRPETVEMERPDRYSRRRSGRLAPDLLRMGRRQCVGVVSAATLRHRYEARGLGATPVVDGLTNQKAR